MEKISKYEVKWFSMFEGTVVSKIVSATSEKEAVEIADPPVVPSSVQIVDDDYISVKDIPDAEALLYEMDANNIDEITTKEGFGKNRTYTRDEIEKSLGLG